MESSNEYTQLAASYETCLRHRTLVIEAIVDQVRTGFYPYEATQHPVKERITVLQQSHTSGLVK